MDGSAGRYARRGKCRCRNQENRYSERQFDLKDVSWCISPFLDDAIDAALGIDKTLSYVTFIVSSFENKDINSNIANPTGPVSVSAFDVLMEAAKAPAVVKLRQWKILCTQV